MPAWLLYRKMKAGSESFIGGQLKTVNFLVAARSTKPARGWRRSRWMALSMEMVWTTRSDGNGDTGQINAIAIDSNNNIYAVGEIDSSDALIKHASSLATPAVTPVDNSSAVAIEYDSNGNVENLVDYINGNHFSSIYNAVSIDSQGRIIAAGSADEDGSTDLDYLLSRFDPSLNPDPNFNGVETDFAEPSSGDDVAYGVRELSDGSIVAGGFSRRRRHRRALSRPPDMSSRFRLRRRDRFRMSRDTSAIRICRTRRRDRNWLDSWIGSRRPHWRSFRRA